MVPPHVTRDTGGDMGILASHWVDPVYNIFIATNDIALLSLRWTCVDFRAQPKATLTGSRKSPSSRRPDIHLQHLQCNIILCPAGDTSNIHQNAPVIVKI